MGEGIDNIELCLTVFGKLASKVMSETTQDLIDTGFSGPKNIRDFVFKKWPSLLGGNFLRNQLKLDGKCWAESTSDKFVQSGIQEALTCFATFPKPLDNVKTLGGKVKSQIQCLPGAIGNISNADTLTGLGKNVIDFFGKAGTSMGGVALAGGKTGLSLASGMPEMLICIGGKKLIKEPKAIIKSSITYFCCVFGI